jgi:predicted nucleotidyltransferase
MALAKENSTLSRHDLRNAIRETVGKYVDLRVYELFIFGSEASRTATRQSDIDVGIRGPQPIAKARIQRIRDDLEKIRTLRYFDVVDLAAADPAFRQAALRGAEKL